VKKPTGTVLTKPHTRSNVHNKKHPGNRMIDKLDSVLYSCSQAAVTITSIALVHCRLAQAAPF